MRFVLIFLFITLTLVDIQAERVEYSTSYSADSLFYLINSDTLQEGRICYMNEFYSVSEEGNKLNIYRTVHKVIFLANDLDIERFNTLRIATSNDINLKDFVARIYDSNRILFNFNQNNLISLDNVGNNISIKMIAFEGLQKHTYLEYSYTIKESAEPYGSIYVEEVLPISRLNVQINYPSKINLVVKSYNGLGSIKDSLLNDNRKLYYSLSENLNPIIGEEYSAYDASIPRLDYIYRAYPGFSSNNFNYLSGSKYFHEIIQSYSKSEVKQVKTLKKLWFGKESEVCIPRLQEKVNSYFNYYPEGGSESIHGMFSTRKASNIGLQRFYACYFHIAKVRYQSILGISRFQRTFDSTFETWSSLKNGFFYLKESGQYFDPSDVTAGTGLPPSEFISSTCLLLDEDGKNFQFLEIENPDKKYTHSDMFITLHFDSLMNKAFIDIEFKHTGYRALELWSAIKNYSKKEMDEFVKNQMKYISSDSKVLDFQVIPKFTLSKNPYPSLSFKGKVEVSSILERADTSYLLKIGELLGEQNELYQEKKRETDIAFHYPMMYERTINIKIPKNLKVKNASQLKMEVLSDKTENSICGFISKSELIHSDTLSVTINEFYNKAKMEKSYFENFKSVVNASADFNKMILLIE